VVHLLSAIPGIDLWELLYNRSQAGNMANELDKYLEATPGTRGGRLRVVGTRITVEDIVLMHLRLGLSLPELAGKYDLPLAAVHTALAYYYDHRVEIDRSIEEDEAFEEAFRRNNPSPLQEKLKELGPVR
jgi:uncharacterized protein (DUF433 family)